MVSSITQSLDHSIDQIQNKLSSISVSQIDQGTSCSKHEVIPTVPELSVQDQHVEPLKLSGALDGFEHFDVTPILGREFVGVNLAEWLRASKSDELLRDLAITSKSIHDI
jgi:hypothetical protein